jgi:hypothetical protein
VIRGRALQGCLLLLMLWSLHGKASEIVYLTPSADTALLEAFPTHNFGGQTYFNAGTTQTYTKNRGLLKFDVADALPPHAKIVSASLTLDVQHTPSDGDTPSTFELHRVLRDWGEGNKRGNPPSLGAEASLNEANWYYRFAETTNAWGAPGGQEEIDYSSISSAEQFVYGSLFSPYTFESTSEMAGDVQAWVNQPADNFGWMLLTQDESLNFSARRFSSRENGYGIPILTVEYFVPAITSIGTDGRKMQIRFLMEVNQTYTLETSQSMAQNNWIVLTNLPAAAEQTNVIVEDEMGTSRRFYRLLVQ